MRLELLSRRLERIYTGIAGNARVLSSGWYVHAHAFIVLTGSPRYRHGDIWQLWTDTNNVQSRSRAQRAIQQSPIILGLAFTSSVTSYGMTSPDKPAAQMSRSEPSVQLGLTPRLVNHSTPDTPVLEVHSCHLARRHAHYWLVECAFYALCPSVIGWRCCRCDRELQSVAWADGCRDGSHAMADLDEC
jgi:hypothetical protein